MDRENRRLGHSHTSDTDMNAVYGHSLVSLALAVMLWASGHVAVAQEAVVILRDKCQVAGPIVRVEDVADVHARNLALKAQISGQRVLRLPAGTDSADIHSSQVRLNLLVAGVRDRDFVMLGANTCHVTQGRETIDDAGLAGTIDGDRQPVDQEQQDKLLRAAIVEFVRGQVAQSLGLQTQQIHVEVQHGAPSEESWRYRPQQTTFQLGTNSRVTLGRSTVSITVLTDGQVQTTWRGTFHITASAPVLIAQTALARGHVTSSDNTTLQTRAIESTRHLVHPQTLLGQAVGRPIQPGEIITPDMLQPVVRDDRRGRPVVRRNTTIPVIARRGSVTVTMPGRAMQDGYVGDFISVRNPDSNKEIPCRIIDADTIEVAF